MVPRDLISYFGGARGLVEVVVMGYMRQKKRRVPMMSDGCGSDVGGESNCWSSCGARRRVIVRRVVEGRMEREMYGSVGCGNVSTLE